VITVETKPPWASTDFFPGEGKIFQGVAKTYYLPKKCPKTYYFLSKKTKTYYFAQSREGKCPLLPSLRTPMETAGLLNKFKPTILVTNWSFTSKLIRAELF